MRTNYHSKSDFMVSVGHSKEYDAPLIPINLWLYDGRRKDAISGVF